MASTLADPNGPSVSGFDGALGSVGSGYIPDIYGGNGVNLSETDGWYDYGGTAGGILNWRDSVEQERMSQGYPPDSGAWWNNFAMGATRLIDSAGRASATANGTLAPTYAGQNGRTYVGVGANANGVYANGSLLPLLLIGGALLLLMK